MTWNQLIAGLKNIHRWASVKPGSEKLSPCLGSELSQIERWTAQAVRAVEKRVKEQESEMGQAAIIIASLTTALAAAEAKFAVATISPVTSIYDAADTAAIEDFLANDPTSASPAETEPTTAAGLVVGGVTQPYTTFNGIQTDAANRTLYIHTGAGGFDTNAWPLAGTVAGENVYYFALDENPGDAKGNGVANSWATIPAIVAPVSTPVAAPVTPTSPASVTPPTVTAPTDGTAAAPVATASTGS